MSINTCKRKTVLKSLNLNLLNNNNNLALHLSNATVMPNLGHSHKNCYQSVQLTGSYDCMGTVWNILLTPSEKKPTVILKILHEMTLSKTLSITQTHIFSCEPPKWVRFGLKAAFWPGTARRWERSEEKKQLVSCGQTVLVQVSIMMHPVNKTKEEKAPKNRSNRKGSTNANKGWGGGEVEGIEDVEGGMVKRNSYIKWNAFNETQ